jgi:hypothetical protein
MVKVRKVLFALGCAAGALLAVIQYSEMFSGEPTPTSVSNSSITIGAARP